MVSLTTVIYIGIFIGCVCLLIICASSYHPPATQEAFANPAESPDGSANESERAGEPDSTTAARDNTAARDTTDTTDTTATRDDGTTVSEEAADYKQQQEDTKQRLIAETQDLYAYQPVSKWEITSKSKRDPVCIPKNKNTVRPLYTTGANSNQLDMGTLMFGEGGASIALNKISKSNMGL